MYISKWVKSYPNKNFIDILYGPISWKEKSLRKALFGIMESCFNQVKAYHFRDGEDSIQGILLLKQFNLSRFQWYGQRFFCSLNHVIINWIKIISNISRFRMIYYTLSPYACQSERTVSWKIFFDCSFFQSERPMSP